MAGFYRDETVEIPLLSSNERGEQEVDAEEGSYRSSNSDLDLPGIDVAQLPDSPKTRTWRRRFPDSFPDSFQFSSILNSRSYIAVLGILAVTIIIFVGANPHQFGQRVSDLQYDAFLAKGVRSALSDKGREPGVEQTMGLDWSGESDLYRHYEWEQKPAHSSLTRMTQTLTTDEARIRAWLKATRPISQRGVPVGLAQSSPHPLPVRPGPAMIRVGRGPGEYKTGSREKWDALEKEWQTGRPQSTCKNTKWMSQYTKLHHEILIGAREPMVLESICRPGYVVECGGISDRLFGMFSSILYAVVTQRALLITWDDLPFELFFDAVNIDWAQPFMPESQRPVHPQLALSENNQSILVLVNPRLRDIVSSYKELLNVKNVKAWVQMQSNRGTVIWSFSQPAFAPVMREHGFDPVTAYACLSDFLFRPKFRALQFITDYSSLFSLPTVFSIAIQIRTGDEAMVDPEKDRRNTVEYHGQFFRCAENMAKLYARPDQKVVYYVVTDSHNLEEDAIRVYPDRVVVTGLSQAHPEIHEGQQTTREAQRLLDGTTDALIEQWLIQYTDYQVMPFRSGFGKIRE
ncbi:BQ2448_6633 [Microbotryum intermedium]|uniref:BQ2448_6633 protein n=1 Tax=Microbotryum intermedium TaxID=269621 RepID=A0A238FPS6_9BASI|nr:BQ2448_6633 [Microbotryum intermedium]